MIIIPKEKPIIENLNSYYLDIRKLLEHYQGELGTGGIHLNSPAAEGVIFFQEEELLNAIFQDKEGVVEGAAAMDRLVEAAADHNFVINIYEISPDRIYFWASLTEAEEIHRDLSTEFTDLEGLIKKMGSEKLTGFIDVSIDKGNETALVFFNNGEIIGGTYSWEKQGLNPSKDSLQLLVQKTKDSGGIFNVSRISSTSGIVDEKKEGPKEEPQADTSTMLEGLLVIFERLTHSNKRIKSDFNTLLKRKLVEKADKYIFLDPFAGEFEYSDQRISFSGGASEMELANGIIEAVVELAEELDILPQLKEELAPWFKKYERDLSNFGISF